MRTAVLLVLLLHACVARQVPADNDEFLASLLGEPEKVKCNRAADIESLTSDEFLALLVNDCENATAEVVQTCERGEFQCTPYHRCRQDDIYSDGQGAFSVRIGRAQFERERDLVSHSECTRFSDVCCSSPLPASVEPEVPEPPYVPQCGRRNQEGLGARIIGFTDSESQFAEFPWVVAVLQVEDIGGVERLSFVAAGSLVHPQLVLTAAHSVARVPPGARVVVRLGEWDTQHETELRPHEDIAVIEVKKHPEFHPTLLRDDVALLVLERPVQLQPHIDTLCLPSPDVNYDGTQCVITGWGKDAMEDGLYQTVLKQIELPHVPRAECQVALRKTRQLGSYFRLDRSFTCAGGQAGRDACTGDGGGPLACRDPQQPGRYVQLGVVSWGLGCGLEGVPGVYADVRRQVTWIGEVISQVERSQVDLSGFERTLNAV